ncbi:acylphosphatase [Lentimicrobium sp.]|jgi:acylphosphatase|uniref:acylphosphatase n=1 Tax=Lentimicrobium sp. TaxID=2034841 RepID=UPI0025D40A22|nr:acylphosphatase [Lentimicrobium sp.]MCO5257993.1 acylphosphatase [Lentimicrobium sp.]MCO5261610.1 acylphosphatase [Lentimicrobium sp.]HOP12551.1 acylphosphatase [Lentimicrobium sp.]HPF64994.1 acylphosphatase [Lentimicrobium sp.]HPJ62597.1 acylphosphatase [Lentimicrobium sp.]
MRIAADIRISIDQPCKGFRFYILNKGREMSLCGSISNEVSQHRILIHAEGEETTVQKYIELISKGSPYCKVLSINATPGEVIHCSRFDIINQEPRPIRSIAPDERPRRFAFKIGIFGL